jgi:AcrR family transcriptional regulator
MQAPPPKCLLDKMGISRQSLYDTFGDKRRLYLEALQRYVDANVAGQIAALQAPSSPLKGVEAMLLAMASKAAIAGDRLHGNWRDLRIRPVRRRDLHLDW